MADVTLDKILLGDTTAEVVEKVNKAINQAQSDANTVASHTSSIINLNETAQDHGERLTTAEGAIEELEEAVENAGKLDSLVVNGIQMVPDTSKKLFLNVGVKTDDKLLVEMETSPNINPNSVSIKFDSSQLIPTSEKGAPNGIATLDENGHVPSSQLPSYVDDVLEGYYYNGEFYEDDQHTQTMSPSSSKIYVDLHTNVTYRWGGENVGYVEISSSLALGETAGTAYEGSKGKANADAILAIQRNYVKASDDFTEGQILIGNTGRNAGSSGKSFVTSIPSVIISTSNPTTTIDGDIPTVYAVRDLAHKRVNMTSTNFTSSTSVNGKTTYTLKDPIAVKLVNHTLIGAFDSTSHPIIVDFTFNPAEGTFTFTVDDTKKASLVTNGGGYFVFQKFAISLSV